MLQKPLFAAVFGVLARISMIERMAEDERICVGVMRNASSLRVFDCVRWLEGSGRCPALCAIAAGTSL